MANLITTISEGVTLNGAVRGTTNTVTTTGIGDVMERIVTCTHSQTTTIATFAAEPYTSAGAIDVTRSKYIRVTNLDENGTIELAVVGTATNYTVRLNPLTSHILAGGEAVLLAEEDTTPSFGTLENIASLQVTPEGTSYNPRVELFVGVAE
jgi:hypothetical protein